jgi:hypothetical protein
MVADLNFNPNFLRQHTANSFFLFGSCSDFLTIRSVTLHTPAAIGLLITHEEECEVIIYPHVSELFAS